MKQIDDEIYEKMKYIVNLYQENYKNLEKIELTKKQITQLRKQVKEKYKEDSYTNFLRTISLYTQTKDKYLKLYVNSLYLQLNS